MAPSSNESEYQAIAHDTTEHVWLKSLLQGFGFYFPILTFWYNNLNPAYLIAKSFMQERHILI